MSNAPHGGILKDLITRDKSRRDELLALNLASLQLTDRQLCDLELLLTGGFSPLEGFLNQKDYESVLHQSRLANGVLWTMPITLDVSQQDIDDLELVSGKKVFLRNPTDDQILAVLTIDDIYKPNKSLEASLVFGKDDQAHPAVHYLHHQTKDFYVGGSLEAIDTPAHYDYQEHRYTPSELRRKFEKLNWTRVVAFQTRNPMHRAHRELTVRAARSQKCHVLIHPVVGMTKPGDVDHYTRVRVYKAILQKYPEGMAGLSLLPLAMRMGGPREAVWHAIIRKNFGCTHFIVGRDHAGPGKDSQGQDFYGPYDAQHLVEKFKDELDIEVVPFKMVAYVPETDEYIPADEVPQGTKTLNISGTELRRRLKTGAAIPDWFTYPDVQAILRQVHPPRSAQGFAILFSGHFNSQLVTIANALESVLNQGGQRPTTLLVPDGKYQVASADYIKHVNFVSAQVAKNGGAVIASPIVYSNSQVQDFVRQVSAVGGGAFVIHVNTPVEKAKENDRSGFYSSLNQDYEAPQNPTLIVDWSRQSVGQIVHEVVLELEKSGYIGSR